MIWLRRLAALLVFAAGVGFIAAADAPVVRYASVANMRACSVQQMLRLPEYLDVVVLGSSRARRAIDPEIMWNATKGRLYSVYNLARPQTEIVRNAIMFRDLLANGRTPQVLVLEVNIDALRARTSPPWRWTPGAAGFSSWLDVAQGPPHVNASTPDPRIVFDGWRVKLNQVILLVASGQMSWVLRKTPEPRQVCLGGGLDRDTPAKRRARDRALARNERSYGDLNTTFDRALPVPLDHVGNAESAVELQTLDYIRSLAHASGVCLIVVRPEAYAKPPLDPEVIAALQDIIPEFRYPPEELARELSRTHIDAQHLGPVGRRLYTRWISRTILNELRETDR